MENEDKKNINLQRVIDLQKSFEKNIRIVERCVAESITNKEKLDSLKKDLNEANEKFIEAERCLDDLKSDIENTTIK
tara:strand:+ start:348 stop:578 length:231 start_codon:yes stop_codon:yes gene_type:complete